MDEVLKYSGSEDLTEATTKELKDFLGVLRKCFQEILPGHYKFDKYRSAVQHVELLIHQRKAWYEKPLGIIVLTLSVCVSGGVIIHLITNHL